MLRNVKVQKYIQDQLDKLHDENTADTKEVMEYLTSVMRGRDETETVLVIDKEAVRMDILPEHREKLKAAELLAKTLGMFDKQAENNNESLEKLGALLKEVKDDAQR